MTKERIIKTPGTPKKGIKLTEANGYRVGQYVDWYPSRSSLAKKYPVILSEIIGLTRTRVKVLALVPNEKARICSTDFYSIQPKRKEENDEEKEMPTTRNSVQQAPTT